MAYELIETIEVGASGVTSIEFTSIPQDGKDLVILTSLRGVGGSGSDLPFNIEFNGTTTDRNAVFVYTINNTSIFSSTSTSYQARGITSNDAGSDIYGMAQIYITNYASTGKKPIAIESTGENDNANTGRSLTSASYAGTSGISQIAMNTLGTTNLKQYSTASIYKIY